jgi:hypothetical protein
MRLTIRHLTNAAILAGFVCGALMATPPLYAEDRIEKAGVVTGLTAGNILFVPIKVMVVSMGAVSGTLSFIFTGGDLEVSRQVWRDTFDAPFLITPDLARRAVGERPELTNRDE